MYGRVKDRVWSFLVDFLTAKPDDHRLSPNDFDVISEKIQAGDVLLVEGRTRVGGIIKTLTKSPWSHSALCIGRLDEIEDLAVREIIHRHYQGPVSEPLMIEAELGRGTVVTPLSFYSEHHVRVAHPIGLSDMDARRLTAFMVSHLGDKYDVKQLLDLARFLVPWWTFVPRKWQSSLFEHNAGQETKNVCSSLIAEGFNCVGFPILPLVERSAGGELQFYRRNPKLYTPRDFDYSPFFKIYKYPLLKETTDGYYKVLRWKEADEKDNQRVNYMNAEDIVFVSAIEDEEKLPINLREVEVMVKKRKGKAAS